MAHQNCSNCSSCKKLKKKLDIYEKLVQDMKEIDNNDNSHNSLRESVIIEKDNYGNINKKVQSDLSESFFIVDHGKNISELNKKEQNIILEQDSYHKYKKTNEYMQKASGVYGAAYYVLRIGKWFLLL